MSVPVAPGETLDPRVRTVWRLTALLWAVPALLLASAAAVALIWRGAPPWLAAVPVLLMLVWAGVSVLLVPDLLFRHWRYHLGEEEIDL